MKLFSGVLVTTTFAQLIEVGYFEVVRLPTEDSCELSTWRLGVAGMSVVQCGSCHEVERGGSGGFE